MTSHNAKYTTIEPGWFVHYEVSTDRYRCRSFKTEELAREYIEEQLELDADRPDHRKQMLNYSLRRVQINILEVVRDDRPAPHGERRTA